VVPAEQRAAERKAVALDLLRLRQRPLVLEEVGQSVGGQREAGSVLEVQLIIQRWRR
jgi:hypothetical protein